MRLAIVGAGKIVSELLSVSDKLTDRYALSAICATPAEKDKLAGLSRQYHIAAVYTDYAEMLKSDVELVYLGVPNSLHYPLARQAIEAGKNVICEKPAVAAEWQLRELLALAAQKNVMVFEAITNQYLSNYAKICELLGALGDIRIISLNYSQYSSRYDRFLQGDILPAFDQKAAGGALMDLNVYNLHFVIGLFGKPASYEYYPNIQNHIDTSGIAILAYPGFKCALIASKDTDCQYPGVIQGEKGYIRLGTPANTLESFDFAVDGRQEHINVNPYAHRMPEEFSKIYRIISQQDRKEYEERCRESLEVAHILTDMRIKSGIIFGCDKH